MILYATDLDCHIRTKASDKPLPLMAPARMKPLFDKWAAGNKDRTNIVNRMLFVWPTPMPEIEIDRIWSW